MLFYHFCKGSNIILNVQIIYLLFLICLGYQGLEELRYDKSADNYSCTFDRSSVKVISLFGKFRYL